MASSESEEAPMLGGKGKLQEPSIKTIGITCLILFGGFIFLEIALLKFTGALQPVIEEVVSRVGLIILAVILIMVFVMLLAIHINHVFKQFQARFDRLEAVIRGEKEVPLGYDPNTRVYMGTVVVLISGVLLIVVEVFFLKFIGQLDPFVQKVEMFAAIGLMAVAFIATLVGIVGAKGYLMFHFFIARFKHLEQMFSGAFSNVMGDVHKVEKAAENCKCSVQ
mmetsp:Transcript_55173/g.101283  ORF Transcript_55173/g.101283 Transcript_55173/m.101283 type:complete len:222 (-) Transcript_55173:231-896(-)